MRTEGLLKQSQLLTAELQAQQEELKKTNDRLEQQAASLRQSEELLRTKQDELQQTNAELEEKAHLLSDPEQAGGSQEPRSRTGQGGAGGEGRAAGAHLQVQVRVPGQHEPRAAHAAEQPADPVQAAEREQPGQPDRQAGRVRPEHPRRRRRPARPDQRHPRPVEDRVRHGHARRRRDVASPTCATRWTAPSASSPRTRSSTSPIELDPDLPRSMYTDDKRLQQIIKNLLSNAFKFTEKGDVTLKVDARHSGWNAGNDRLNNAGQVLAFSVEDTGIGIPEDKQRIIFEAFQQADGTTSRKYGGTGLGLSISREIARLLGGELTVSARRRARARTFTLYLPLNFSPPAQPVTPQPARGRCCRAVSRPSSFQTRRRRAVVDDRDAIEPGDPVVLIVEDDPRFASILLDLAREAGFKGVVTGEGGGRAGAGPAVRARTPSCSTSACRTWTAWPCSTSSSARPRRGTSRCTSSRPTTSAGLGLSMGAFGFTAQAGRARGGGLDPGGREELRRHGRAPDRCWSAARRGAPTSCASASSDVEIGRRPRRGPRPLPPTERPDCVVVEARRRRPPRPGRAAEAGARPRRPPVVVYAPARAGGRRRPPAAAGACSAAWSRMARTPDQLVDQASLLLHAPLETLPAPAQPTLAQSRHDDAVLAGRKVAGHRRRHPQHLLARQRAGGVRHRAALRRERPGGPRAAGQALDTSTSCWSTS